MSDGYISVRNWRRFQHYTDRNPPWIKNYTELTSNDDYRALPASTRGVLHGVWIEYATSLGRLPNNTRDISGRLGLRVTKRQLQRLNDAGFIDFVASADLAEGASTSRTHANALAREETETETETPKPPFTKKTKNVRQAERWIANGNASHYPPERLGAVIEDEFDIHDANLIRDLIGQAHG